MILITSIGEFLLYYCQLIFFISIHYKKKKRVAAGICFFFFGVILGSSVLTAREHVPVD